ncbi:multiheme c-type cytochrome [Sediminibacterium soli]|uniref:multiheme c-type cytochrome n=1 Tax=Sediminibacterium soli TaxID=2698829 RepID=UPI00137A0EC8|nr:multiheme c-type cytochrome [Sediminibacterium soli]NCI46782.1 hypothetical protein [Sediminibacterium soli]
MFRKKWIQLLTALCLLAVLFQYCVQKQLPEFNDPRGKAYAGSSNCMSCHAEVFTTYQANAHMHSSGPVSHESMRRYMAKGDNRFVYRSSLEVRIEEKENRYYQTAYDSGKAKASFPFDMAIGSGRKAQTFLYWYDATIYQLPISYSLVGQCWANSPNYPKDKARFDRSIPVGCFECHASYIERTGVMEQRGYRIDAFDKTRLIYGIDCERCHGPAAAHVAYQQDHPAEKTAKYIAAIKSLTNVQQMEACATCHSGLHEPLRSPFLFRPGNTLKDFYRADTGKFPASELDVHGNQYQLLMASKCFRASVTTMSCSTCHNPHRTERSNMEVYSVKCMNCHQPGSKHFCTLAAKAGATIVKNCIDCHMPSVPSRIISLEGAQHSNIANRVRSHLIGKYGMKESGQFSK